MQRIFFFWMCLFLSPLAGAGHYYQQLCSLENQTLLDLLVFI